MGNSRIDTIKSLRKFYEINKDRFLPILKWTSIIFIVIVISIICYQTIILNKKMGAALIVAILIFSSVILPIFITIVGTAQDYISFYHAENFFNKLQFDNLLSKGFKFGYSNLDTKLLTRLPVIFGQINNYPVSIEYVEKCLKTILPVDLDIIQDHQIARLREIFGKNNVHYDIGIALVYYKKQQKTLTSIQVENDLTLLIKYLNGYKITSFKENDNT